MLQGKVSFVILNYGKLELAFQIGVDNENLVKKILDITTRKSPFKPL